MEFSRLCAERAKSQEQVLEDLLKYITHHAPRGISSEVRGVK